MYSDLGILVIRVLFGAAMAAHGAQKLFGWFGGYGPKATGAHFESLGFRPGVPFAVAAGFSEFAGGALLTLGLLTPIGAALVLSTMIVAMVSVHLKNGFFSMSNGIEVPYLYAAAAIGLAFTGAGDVSFDAFLGLDRLFHPTLIAGLLALSVFGSVVTLASRRQPVEARQAA